MLVFFALILLALLGLANLGIGVYTMATVASLTADLAQLKTDVETERQQAADRQAAVVAQLEAQTTEIARLNDIIAQGGAVSQADLDALAASVAEVDAAVKNIIPDTTT